MHQFMFTEKPGIRLSNFPLGFYNTIEKLRTFFFLSLLANTGVKTKTSNSFISIFKIQTLFTHGITMSKALVVLCFYQVLEVKFLASVFLQTPFPLLHVIRFQFSSKLLVKSCFNNSLYFDVFTP